MLARPLYYHFHPLLYFFPLLDMMGSKRTLVVDFTPISNPACTELRPVSRSRGDLKSYHTYQCRSGLFPNHTMILFYLLRRSAISHSIVYSLRICDATNGPTCICPSGRTCTQAVVVS